MGAKQLTWKMMHEQHVAESRKDALCPLCNRESEPVTLCDGGKPPEGEVCYTRQEAIDYLGCSPSTFSRYVSRGLVAEAGFQPRPFVTSAGRRSVRFVAVYAKSELDSLPKRGGVKPRAVGGEDWPEYIDG